MINLSIHNVTEVSKTRICKSDSPDPSGWIVLNIGAQNYSWDDEDQVTIFNEVTFFFKDLELGLAQLRTEIDKGISSFRKEELENLLEREKELSAKELKANG